MWLATVVKLTLARRFWATAVCLRTSKTSKICVLGRVLGDQFFEKKILKIVLDIFWKNGINSYQYNTAWAIIFNNTINRPKGRNFNKIETLTQMFFYEFCKISGNNFFTEHIRATAFGLSFVNPRKKSVKRLV